ncbi:hypothetical protein SAMN05216553_104508 [Lentzea fradiae]|uniref:Uncharacterized protein n=1 Tax=Lentzea fradiae TaxID=200378 RepID=A0A1G7QLD9_9PSEU|nr:hypothetical protein [Lentzea fradiae]SDF99302.1 hypothetical protein SAMN05216553_104508 [Lentzea fradiae]
MTHRHFAVVNHFHPHVRDPFLLLRQRGKGFERFTEDRDWVPAGRQWALGEPVEGTLLNHLLTSWTPRPVRTEHRFFAFLDENGEPLRLAHLWNDANGVLAERTFVSEGWRVVGPCVFEGDRRVEIDETRARELEAVVTRNSREPADGRYRYWAVLDPVLQRVLRTWGGEDGTRYAQWSMGPRWHRVHVLDVVRDGTAQPVAVEVAEELRRSFPAIADSVGAAPAGCHQPS